MPPKKTYPCIICKQNVSDRDTKGSINCCVCDRYTHAGCADIDPKVLGWFKQQEQTTGHHFYSCEGCSKAYHRLNTRVADLENRLKKVENNTDKLQLEVEVTRGKADKAETIALEAKQSVKSCKDAAIKESTKAWSSELRERRARENNVIVFGIEELSIPGARPDARKKHDIQEFTSLLEEIGCSIDVDNDIKFIVRVGELKQDADNPRPLKIGLRTQEVRENIFEKARNIPDTTYHEVNVVPDLTKMQREEEKELVAEAKKQTEEQDDEDFLVYEFKCMGRKGERVIRRVKKMNDQVPPQRRGQRGVRRARGGRASLPHTREDARPVRGGVRTRGGHVRTPRSRDTSTEVETEDQQEEEVNDPKRKLSDNSMTSISPSSPGFSGTSKRQRRAMAAAAAAAASTTADY